MTLVSEQCLLPHRGAPGGSFQDQHGQDTEPLPHDSECSQARCHQRLRLLDCQHARTKQPQCQKSWCPHRKWSLFGSDSADLTGQLAHAPMKGAPQLERAQCWSEYEIMLRQQDVDESELVVLIDASARVGSITSRHVGAHNPEKQNKSGRAAHEFMREFSLCRNKYQVSHGGTDMEQHTRRYGPGSLCWSWKPEWIIALVFASYVCERQQRCLRKISNMPPPFPPVLGVNTHEPLLAKLVRVKAVQYFPVGTPALRKLWILS